MEATLEQPAQPRAEDIEVGAQRDRADVRPRGEIGSERARDRNVSLSDVGGQHQDT